MTNRIFVTDDGTVVAAGQWSETWACECVDCDQAVAAGKPRDTEMMFGTVGSVETVTKTEWEEIVTTSAPFDLTNRQVVEVLNNGLLNVIDALGVVGHEDEIEAVAAAQGWRPL